MADLLTLALADPKNSPKAAAETAVTSVIDAKDPALLYSEELILALARAGSIAQFEAKRRLLAIYPKDFHGNVREWQARIRACEDSLRAESSPQSDYLRSESGVMKTNVANAITMMRALPISYDTFSCRVVLTDVLPWESTFRPTWLDTDDVKAAEWCQHQRLDIKPQTAADAAMAVSKERHINPPLDYLQSLKWDGTCRLDRWLWDYLGVPDTAYARAVGPKWMISAVARIVDPGCQADYTLVLEGPQGKKKSSALRILGGNWFTDDLTDVGTKDSAGQLQGKWIVEIAELDAFRKAEMTTIKAWLVRRVDNFRPAYGRRTVEFPRQNVFAASTNKDEWGQDETGLRRFWPVRIGEIKLPPLTADRDQLWAEAMFRYSEGESTWLSGEAEDSAAVEQHERQDSDVWKDLIETWIEHPIAKMSAGIAPIEFRSTHQRVYLDDLLFHCLGILARDINNGHKSRAGKVLRLAGWIQCKETAKEADGAPRRQYWTCMRERVK